MESLDKAASFVEVDDLLDFASDIGEGDDEEDKNKKPLLSVNPSGRSLPEFAEEELEWISNKDAFPAVETFVDILSEDPGNLSKHHSPVSVLENSTTSSQSNNSSNSNSNSNSKSNSNSNSNSTLMSCCVSFKAPGRARSERRWKHRPDIRSQQFFWSQHKNAKTLRAVSTTTITSTTTTTIGRKCQHCGAEKTPQWRAGPYGPKTLCNACGVRYKSGRLVPEYRPASSPTFSARLHSNSHRKVMEMRRQKQVGIGNVMVVKPVDKG